jgi:hypothetical protein
MAPISIAFGRPAYDAGQPISVLIRNALDGPIATVDQQAFCGVLRLDRMVGAGWEEIQTCVSGPPPRDVVIASGDERSETWQAGLGKGVYRARLVYSNGTAFVAGNASEITSGRLTVG